MVSSTGNEEEISIDEALNKIGVGSFHYRVSITGGIILFSSYLSIGVVTFFMPAAQCDLGMKSEQKGYLAAISFVGIILTAHLWGFLSDTLGRRYVIIRCLLCDGLLYFITMLTSSYYIILVLRFFNGIASCGGVVSVYAYVGELQPTQFRPRSLMIVSLVGTIAYVFLPGVAWLTIPSNWAFELYPGLILKSWRLFYIANGIPSILSVILLLFMPESPKFLIARGENEKAVEVLHTIYKSKNNNDDNFTIKNIKSNEQRIGKLRDDKNKIMAFVFLMWDQTIPLLKKPHLSNFVLLASSLITTFFCNNGMYVWLPVAINKMSIYEKETGKDVGTFCDLTQYVTNQSINQSKETRLTINENEFYTSDITTDLFKAAEEKCIEHIDTSVYKIFLTLGCFQILSWIIIVIIIKYINKKYFLFGLSLCVVATVVSLKIPNQLISVPLKSSLIILFTAAIFPIVNSLVVDFFPTNVRGMAGCLTLLSSRIGSICTNLMSGFLIDKHCDVLIWIHICSISICALSIMCLPSSSAALGKEQKRPSKTEEA